MANDNGVEEVIQMRKVLQHMLAVFAVTAVVGTLACQQRQEVDDETGADTLLMQDTTTMAPPPPTTTDTMDDTMMGHDTMDMGADTSSM